MSSRKLMSVIPLIWILINIFLCFFFPFGWLKPKVLEAQQKLTSELSYIIPPKQTTWKPIEIGKSNIPSVAWIRQVYLTELEVSNLIVYYDKELARNGWELRNKYVVTAPSPFAPFSAGEVCEYGCWRTYCKGSYSATIDYRPSGQYFVSLRNDEFRTCDDVENPTMSLSEALYDIAFPFWFLCLAAGYILLQRRFSNH